MSGAETAGRCLCGAVRWSFTGPTLWQRYCHCDSCRRNCAAPVAAFLAVPVAALRWTGEMPSAYASSPGVTRRFCGRCGTPVSYEWQGAPEEIHIYAAALDNPRDVTPEGHDFWSEHLPWLALRDGLPKRD